MRSRIFLYLFIFAVLYIIFQYVNAENVYTSQEKRIESLSLKVERFRSENDSLLSKVATLENFTLMGNSYAQNYFEEEGIDSRTIQTKITDALLEQNSIEEDNSFVPFAGMEGPMRINSIQVLNSKWAIANFTDGKFWGEIFILYTLDESGQLTLEVKDEVLYPEYE